MDALLQETESHCNAMREQLHKEIEKTIEGCRALKADFANITEHISSELRRMDVAVSQLPISFNCLQNGLEALEQEATKQ